MIEVGDLIEKYKGYCPAEGPLWTGVVCGILYHDDKPFRVEVLTSDGIEHWHISTVRKI